ncbi:GNAT family N-acetyltransferase, partial [Bacillus atrophaeus]
LAFLAVWEFAEFVFIEHFAVSEKARNSGIGGKMLEELARQKAGKVVLEVELPEDSLKKRRIGFYERHGFTFNEYPYIQPPMGEDRHE